MNRKDFLVRLGLGAAGFAIFGPLDACRSKDDIGQADFTIDLTMPEYSQLQNLGGYVYYQGIIIAKDITNNYVAVSRVCTHQACDVEFTTLDNCFLCPCHQALFETNGQVKRGPATEPLISYHTQLSGNYLRVYS